MTPFLLMAAALAGAQEPPPPPPAPTDLLGHWKHGAMEIVIAPCGPALCGTVVSASAQQQDKALQGSGTQLIGTKVIDNIHPTGPQSWKASVFIPNGNMYAKGTIEEIGPDQLSVRGCVAIMCKTTEWDRVPPSGEAPAPNP